MASRNYERLSIEKFGKHLIASGDLDPVYIALAKGKFSDTLIRRWLLAYWCFYDCGVASYLSEREGSDFWAAMAVAAENVEPAPTGGRWTRAKERRHFRGKASVKAVEKLKAEYHDYPEWMAEYCAYGSESETGRMIAPTTCAEVMKRAKEHYLFGDWIAFKVADMLERILGYHISFDAAEVLMFKDPRDSALILFRERAGLPADAKILDESAAVMQVLSHLKKHFSDMKAPPKRDRAIGFQEVETVLCKWKSHQRGHYPLNNDITEIRESVEQWTPHSDTAKTFLGSMPEPM